MTWLGEFGRQRTITHIVLAAITALGCYLAYLYRPDREVVRVLTVGLGYVGLLFIIFTLLVGPYKLLWQRRNPVNINLRRDIGIWAGLTGAAHVVVGFQVHQRGRILRYFFNKDGEFLTNLFGASNVAGLFATLLIILLLLLSNDISLKQLKGPRWKFLQRFNYVLFVLVVAHTFGYQMEINREAVATYAVIGLTGLVLVLQLIGLMVYRSRGGKVKVESTAG